MAKKQEVARLEPEAVAHDGEIIGPWDEGYPATKLDYDAIVASIDVSNMDALKADFKRGMREYFEAQQVQRTRLALLCAQATAIAVADRNIEPLNQLLNAVGGGNETRTNVLRKWLLAYAPAKWGDVEYTKADGSKGIKQGFQFDHDKGKAQAKVMKDDPTGFVTDLVQKNLIENKRFSEPAFQPYDIMESFRNFYQRAVTMYDKRKDDKRNNFDHFDDFKALANRLGVAPKAKAV